MVKMYKNVVSGVHQSSLVMSLAILGISGSVYNSTKLEDNETVMRHDNYCESKSNDFFFSFLWVSLEPVFNSAFIYRRTQRKLKCATVYFVHTSAIVKPSSIADRSGVAVWVFVVSAMVTRGEVFVSVSANLESRIQSSFARERTLQLV